MRWFAALVIVAALSIAKPSVADATDSEGAIQWAEAHIGLHDWDGWCLSFVQQAFQGPSSAADAYKFFLRLGEPNKGSTIGSVARGALVFFGPTPTNPYGHVAIALGGGRMIGSLNAGPITGVQETDMAYVRNFVGWSVAPADWPGRNQTTPVAVATAAGTASPVPVTPASRTPTPQPATAAPTAALPTVAPARTATPAPPAATPSPAPTTSPAPATDIFGTVVWNTTPIAGLRIELWTGVGNGGTMVSALVTRSDGSYRFPSVGSGTFTIRGTAPSGEYWDLSTDLGGVRASATARPVYMLKKMQTLSPSEAASVAGPSVTLIWSSVAEVSFYRVIVTDTSSSGNMPTVVDARATTTTYTFGGALSGHSYSWNINAWGQCGCVIATPNQASFSVR